MWILPAIVTTRTTAHSSLIAFRGPWPASLLLFSGLLVFSPLLDGGTTHLAVMVIRLMVLFLATLYVSTGIRTGAFACPHLRIGPAALAYLGLATVSTVVSPYYHQSQQWLLVLLSYAGLLYLLVSCVREWDHISKLLVMLAGMGLFEALAALVQVLWFRTARPTGTFFNPNFLAGYLAAIWAVVLGVLCYVGTRRAGRRRLPRWALALSVAWLAVLLVAIIWSGSRGGMLAFLAGTGLVAGVRFGRKGLGVLTALLLVGLLVPNPLRDRLWTEHVVNPLSYTRWQMWQSSLLEMTDHRLGVGLGLYQYVYPRHALPVEGQITRYGKQAQSAHSEYLQMGVELGIVSLLLFAWGLFLLAREAVAALRLRLRRWQRGVVVGASGAVVGILTHAAVDSNLHEPSLAIVLTLCTGIILSARRLSGALPEPWWTLPIHSWSSRAVWTLVAVATVGILAVTTIRLGVAWTVFEDGSRALARQDAALAIADYRVAITLDPGKALYHSAIAGLYFQMFEQTGERRLAQESMVELQSAMALNPLDGRLPDMLGRVYLGLASSLTAAARGGQGEERTTWLRSALVAYEQAASLEPYSAFHRYELGRVHLALGDRRTAEDRFREAVDLEPNFLPGRERLARLYLWAGRIEEARREYREILARQQRYADWPKDPIEERFLSVDLAEVEAGLRKFPSHT